MENPREEDRELHGGLHIIWSSIKHKELLVEGYQASHLNIRHPRYGRTPRPFLDHGNGAHALPLSLRSSAAMAVGEGCEVETGGKKQLRPRNGSSHLRPWRVRAFSISSEGASGNRWELWVPARFPQKVKVLPRIIGRQSFRWEWVGIQWELWVPAQMSGSIRDFSGVGMMGTQKM